MKLRRFTKRKLKRLKYSTRADRILTLANGISISRIFLTLPLIYYLDKDNLTYAIGIILLIILSDLIDGWVARRVDEITHFGKLIDPVADKICMMVVIIFLIFKIGIPMFAFFLILAIRDIVLITIGVYLMFKRDRVFESNKTGKWFIFISSLMMLSFILNLPLLISYTLYWVSLSLFTYSTYCYLDIYLKLFKEIDQDHDFII